MAWARAGRVPTRNCATTASVLDRRRLGLAAAGDRLSVWPVVPGNSFDVLHNGEKAYPPMLEAIERARRFVYLTTYILETNRVGQHFVAALARAADRGVDVRVLVDGVGRVLASPGPACRAAAAPARRGRRRFLPPRLFPPSLRINLRNHRKILVTDAGVAFTGGMNIGDRHLVREPGGTERAFPAGRADRAPDRGRVSLRLGVRHRQADRREPPPSAGGRARGLPTIENGPTRDTERLATLLQTAVTSARRRVLIMTPYFLPGPALIGVLQAAALRGLDVSVVLPAQNNLPFVEWASRHALGELMVRGVKISTGRRRSPIPSCS